MRYDDFSGCCLLFFHLVKNETKKTSMLLLTVIAGELGCLSMITYILPPRPQQHL